MRKMLLVLSLLLFAPVLHAGSPRIEPAWMTKVAEALPLLGHRNWILIVDSAYPLQASAGVETVVTNASQIEVVRHVLGVIDSSIHVRPEVYMDAELPFLTDEDAPGVSAYRREIGDLLGGRPIVSLPHDKVIANIDEAGKLVHVLVLKTNMAIPYTSVFIRLNCKYWSDDAEKKMRAKMAAAAR